MKKITITKADGTVKVFTATDVIQDGMGTRVFKDDGLIFSTTHPVDIEVEVDFDPTNAVTPQQ